MGQDPAFVLPSLEALANLCLTPEQQSRVVEAAAERFQSADAGDLPAVTRFLLQHAAPGAELKKVSGRACWWWVLVGIGCGGGGRGR